MKKSYHRFGVFCFVLLFWLPAISQKLNKPKIVPAGPGWAGNSVNTVVFRKNSLCSYGNTQYISYYNKEGFVVLGKRKLNASTWELLTTRLKGMVTDAHNSISIMTDGDGYLHMAWNHHGNTLHYCKSKEPGSLEMTEETSMTGSLEKTVTYPEFYTLPDGRLLFFYRDGQSGQGNLVINRYSTTTKQWQQLHSNLIDGEKQRNAYWQACVDKKGTIHLSWVWRESADVASNHDLCYARSKDGGTTWENSKGEAYRLPIRAETAETICRIPEKSELINQTSMTATDEGMPLIASYWKETGDAVPQYHLVFQSGDQWQVQNLGFRKTPFSLSGTGTKRIPISRPQVIAWKKNRHDGAGIIYRDEESGNFVSMALNEDLRFNNWKRLILSKDQVGSWEPSFDTDLWKNRQRLDLFVQLTEQADSEGRSGLGIQEVKVLSVRMK